MIARMSTGPDMATFARLVDTDFVIRHTVDAAGEVKLVEFRQAGSQPGYEQFSLVFRAPADMAREQRIYALDHPETGPFELFLVPIGLAEGALLLEAVINRRVDPADGG